MLEINSIYNGDCLELLKEVPSNSCALIFTDLPFGVTNKRNEWDKTLPMETLWKEWLRIRKDEATPIILSAMQPFSSLLIASNPDMFKYEWIWRKSSGKGFLNAKKQPLRNHESVLVFYEKQCIYNPQFTEGKPYKCKQGGHGKAYAKRDDEIDEIVTINDGKRYPVTILDFEYDKEKFHSTQKPIPYCEYFINTYSNPGDMVLDCCCGSGSIPLAAKNLNRRFIGIEKDEKYFKTAQERLAGVISTSPQTTV